MRTVGVFWVSVPFARGTPPWRARRNAFQPPIDTFQSPSRGGHLRGQGRAHDARYNTPEFQSPSRGGHLRGSFTLFSGGPLRPVSVPFARGTPPWRSSPWLWELWRFAFQSPSRGGHLRGDRLNRIGGWRYRVSVPFARGTPPWRSLGRAC